MSQSNLKLAFSSSNVWAETACTAVKQQIKATSATVKAIEMVNTGQQDVYFKGYFATAGSVTLGSTAPDFIFMVPALKTRRIYMPGAGAVYPTALTVAATSDKGTAGATAPTVPISVKVVYS